MFTSCQFILQVSFVIVCWNFAGIKRNLKIKVRQDGTLAVDTTTVYESDISLNESDISVGIERRQTVHDIFEID